MRKSTYILVSVFAVVIVALLMFTYSEEITELKYKGYVDNYIENLEQADVLHMAENYIFTPPMDGTWYSGTNLVYHACGGIDGVDYSNSREAMDQTLEAGNKVIEVDFMFTGDGRLVCVHDWKLLGFSEIPSYSEFMSAPVYGRYTPLDAEAIVEYMMENPDIRIVLDTKEEQLQDVVAYIVGLCNGDTSVIDRLIVQVYAAGQKAEVQEVYEFPDTNFAFSPYKVPYTTNEMLNVCYDENIYVVIWPSKNDNYGSFVSHGLIVYIYTVNRLDQWDNYTADGVTGVYTDFLTEDVIGG